MSPLGTEIDARIQMGKPHRCKREPFSTNTMTRSCWLRITPNLKTKEPALCGLFRTYCGPVLRQVLAEELEHLLPAVHRLLLAIVGAVVIEEAMTGTVVTVKLLVLDVLLQFFLMHVHLLR